MTSELSCWEKGDAAKTGRNIEHMKSTTRVSRVLVRSFIRISKGQDPTLDFPFLKYLTAIPGGMGLSFNYVKLKFSFGVSVGTRLQASN
jgi:hypothetical protein